MPNTIVIGAQWGDEGKGKIVDLLCSKMDYIVRFQGGNNAGHTVIANGNTYKLHLIPSGILHEKKICLIGNGVVLDPQVFIDEIRILKKQNICISADRLKISHKTHLIMPYHKALDIARESNSCSKIGTTGRGIGPCYEDKVHRIGIRAIDITQPEILYKKISIALKEKNILLQQLYQSEMLSVETIYNDIMAIAPQIIPYLSNISEELQQAIQKEKKIMFEGAQGVHLDVDHGTYPFVTSSNTIAANASIGSGIALTCPDTVIGVLKAYTTRVGEGPFLTELNNIDGDTLRNRGMEFGTTTGRPRRCGWQDIVMLRESIRLNGFTELALTKLDVLSSFKKIKICIAYTYENIFFEYPPQNEVTFNTMTPVYEILEGWDNPLETINSWNDLPIAAQKYICRIEELVQLPITIISVGAERNQTLFRTKSDCNFLH